MAARIAELEDAADQARNRANKLEKDKNKLQIEIRDLTVQLESVRWWARRCPLTYGSIRALGGEPCRPKFERLRHNTAGFTVVKNVSFRIALQTRGVTWLSQKICSPNNFVMAPLRYNYVSPEALKASNENACKENLTQKFLC